MQKNMGSMRQNYPSHRGIGRRPFFSFLGGFRVLLHYPRDSGRHIFVDQRDGFVPALHPT